MSPSDAVPRPPAWEALHYLPERAGSLLDVGCNAGEALEHAHRLGVARLVGVEINPGAARLARERLAGAGARDVSIHQGSADTLPLPDGAMDAAICCEVLEHVPEELRPAVIREVHRVLREGAPFIITVPARGAFAALDPANVRFHLPGAYRAVSRLIGGRGREAGYEHQKHGVVWHHHFTLDELRRLLGPGFRIREVRWRGALATPLCDWLLFPLYRWKAYRNPVTRALQAVQRLEMAIPAGPALAYNVLVVAEKVRPE